MATDKITSGYKTGSISGSNSFVVRQYGRVVTINGYANMTLNGGTVAIGTLSGVDWPDDTIRAIAAIAVHAYDPPVGTGYLSIDYTNGKVNINSSISGSRSVYFSLSYIV